MNCNAANRLYVRANGTVPCNCDVGENVTLFAPKVDDLGSFSYADDCYNGKPFRKLRDCFQHDRTFLRSCQDCFFYSPAEPFRERGADGRLTWIEDVQVESSFLCTLDCAACVPRSIRRDPGRSPLGEGPYNLPMQLFEKLIDDLSRARVGVGEFNFCGRGEPLLHPQFTELITYARRFFPSSLYTAVTGANLRYFPGLLDLDYLTVSIDGAFPDSYARYRRGGRLATALRLVEDVLGNRRPATADTGAGMPELREHLAQQGRPIVLWKYLLFEHNDSEEEIVAAQEMALAMGVDQMMFYLSHTWNRSKTYTSMKQIEELPLFQVFQRKKVFRSNVNAEVGNVERWEREGRRRARESNPGP